MGDASQQQPSNRWTGAWALRRSLQMRRQWVSRYDGKQGSDEVGQDRTNWQPVKVNPPNRHVGPMALRKHVTPFLGAPQDSGANQTVDQWVYTPVKIANRWTGPQALRFQGLLRHQWQAPWGGDQGEPVDNSVSSTETYYPNVILANRWTGPQALRRQLQMRRNWYSPYSGGQTGLVRVTQELVEVIATHPGSARVTHQLVEVLRRSSAGGGPQVIIVG